MTLPFLHHCDRRTLAHTHRADADCPHCRKRGVMTSPRAPRTARIDAGRCDDHPFVFTATAATPDEGDMHRRVRRTRDRRARAAERRPVKFQRDPSVPYWHTLSLLLPDTLKITGQLANRMYEIYDHNIWDVFSTTCQLTT